MDIKEYQKESVRTLKILKTKLEDNLHMMLGLQTEVAELADIYKKQFAYGKEPDIVNAKEEVGDLMWYISNYCNINNISLEECMQMNIDKLKTRYPHKYSDENAINRDLQAERKALKGLQ